MKEPVIIIPARLESTRLPRKMLRLVNGKPVIRWTVEAALETGFRVIVATDSTEIANASGASGVCFTAQCANGTERVIDAARRSLGNDEHLVINWQGDSPMTNPDWVRQLAKAMEECPHAVGTIHQEADFAVEGDVWVSYDNHCQVASFARTTPGHPLTHRHIGIYAIKPAALDLYGRCPSPLELQSGLEQYRWIDRGVAVISHLVEGAEGVEINTEEDLARFGAQLESAREAA